MNLRERCLKMASDAIEMAKEFDKSSGYLETSILKSRERIEKIMTDAIEDAGEKQKEEARKMGILLAKCRWSEVTPYSERTEQSYKEEIAKLRYDADCYESQYEQQKAFKEDVMDSCNCMHVENEQLKKQVENQRKSIVDLVGRLKKKSEECCVNPNVVDITTISDCVNGLKVTYCNNCGLKITKTM